MSLRNGAAIKAAECDRHKHDSLKRWRSHVRARLPRVGRRSAPTLMASPPVRARKPRQLRQRG